MKNLAELAFDHIWLMLFGTDDQIDPDYAVMLQESLALMLPELTPKEQDALADVAREAKARLLAEPDGHGYTPCQAVTEQQRLFLDSVIEHELCRWLTDT